MPSAPAAATEDDDDDDEDEAPAKPLAYLDLTTFYASASGPAFLLGGPRVTSLTLTTGSSQSALVDAPLTIDFNDRFSAYVAISGSSFASGPAPWTAFRADSWRTGFVADVIEQTDWLPTVTVSGFVSRPFDHSSLAFLSTTYSAALDLDRTLDAEETRGLIAGGSLTRITVDTGPVKIGSIFMVYGGAYRRFDDWKLSARAGFRDSRERVQGRLLKSSRSACRSSEPIWNGWTMTITGCSGLLWHSAGHRNCLLSSRSARRSFSTSSRKHTGRPWAARVHFDPWCPQLPYRKFGSQSARPGHMYISTMQMMTMNMYGIMPAKIWFSVTWGGATPRR